jgi:hypothetical protein
MGAPERVGAAAGVADRTAGADEDEDPKDRPRLRASADEDRAKVRMAAAVRIVTARMRLTPVAAGMMHMRGFHAVGERT